MVVNRGPHALRAKAKTFTVGLQLEQIDVARLLEEHQTLSNAYMQTVKELAHYMNPDTLRKDWLFSGAAKLKEFERLHYPAGIRRFACTILARDTCNSTWLKLRKRQ